MCLSIFKRICHWGPLIALGIIKIITFGTTTCLSVWYPPWSTYGGTAIFLSFMSFALATLYFFMQSIFTGPGRLPKNWHPENKKEEKFLQFCHTCDGFKAPRAHHCRSCNSCNMKMDHHCPWINNCVGHKNHTYFTMFVCCAVIGCSQASIIIMCTLYRAFYRNWYIVYGRRDELLISMGVWALIGNTFILGLALGVVFAVGTLAYFQLRAILRNRTAIEDWILEKANFRRYPDYEPFVYPYDLGKLRNFKQVLNWDLTPVGDGIKWNVRKGCHQYTLTIEQLEQKMEKRARSKEYLITSGYSGWWFPFTKGLCVCLHPPCTDEPRISLKKNDVVVVTRWKRYWLYGERAHQNDENNTQKKRHRGWFPRVCAVEILDKNEVDHNRRKKSKKL